LSRYLKAHCNKCGQDFKFDIGEKTPEQTKETMEAQKMFTCPGRHVEISGPLEYVTVDWANVVVADPPMSDEAYGGTLIKEFGKERLFYLGDEETGKKLGIESLHSLKDLRHIGFGEFQSDTSTFARHDSPSGFRFYVALPR
jgi:hypothetical protein